MEMQKYGNAENAESMDDGTADCGNMWIAEMRMDVASALKSSPVPVLGLSGLGPWTGPVLIFPNMEGPQTRPPKTGFTRSWAVLGPVLVKTDS